MLPSGIECRDAAGRDHFVNRLRADETGINIGGKRHWLHCTTNASVTWFYSHGKRGTDAMDEMGILSLFKGVLCF